MQPVMSDFKIIQVVLRYHNKNNINTKIVLKSNTITIIYYSVKSKII